MKAHFAFKRRGVLRAIAASAAAVALPKVGDAYPENGFAKRLQHQLNQATSQYTDRSFALLNFEVQQDTGHTVFTVVVRLTWQPGTRQRKFTCQASCAESAFETLQDRIQTEFTV